MSFIDGFGCKSTLDDVLVKAPVIEVGNPQTTDENGDAGEVHELRIVFLQNHLEVIRCGIHKIAHAGEESLSVADEGDCNIGSSKAADNQDNNLNNVGPNYSA